MDPIDNRKPGNSRTERIIIVDVDWIQLSNVGRKILKHGENPVECAVWAPGNEVQLTIFDGEQFFFRNQKTLFHRGGIPVVGVL